MENNPNCKCVHCRGSSRYWKGNLHRWALYRLSYVPPPTYTWEPLLASLFTIHIHVYVFFTSTKLVYYLSGCKEHIYMIYMYVYPAVVVYIFIFIFIIAPPCSSLTGHVFGLCTWVSLVSLYMHTVTHTPSYRVFRDSGSRCEI